MYNDVVVLMIECLLMMRGSIRGIDPYVCGYLVRVLDDCFVIDVEGCG